jgi:hypothetical protein
MLVHKTKPVASKAAVVVDKTPSEKKPATKSAIVPTAAPATTTATVDAKFKKPKLVRDSFTVPKDEYAAIDELKLRAAQQGHIVKKSELLRAGLKLLSSLNDQHLLQALQAVPSIKTGRPAKTEETQAKPRKPASRSSAKVQKAAKAS